MRGENGNPDGAPAPPSRTCERVFEVVNLDSIVVSAKLQIRAATNSRTVEQYAKAMKNGALFPPVKLARFDRKLILVDGFHRIDAARRNGDTDTNAVIVDVASFEEAQWLAAEANLCHGQPLKSREIRSAFRAYVRAKRHRVGCSRVRLKSYRQISEELGGRVAYTTVRNWMRKDFPSTAKAMGEDNQPRMTGDPKGADIGVIFAREARASLSKLRAQISMLTTPQARWEVRELLMEAARDLEAAGIEEPIF